MAHPLRPLHRIHSIYALHPVIQPGSQELQHFRPLKICLGGAREKFRIGRGGIFADDLVAAFLFPRAADIRVFRFHERLVLPFRRGVLEMRDTVRRRVPIINHVRELVNRHIVIIRAVLHASLGPLPALTDFS